MTPDGAQGVVDQLFAAFARLGDRHYGEEVTQTEHMLQTAALAERARASGALIVAALLHDYGHFLHEAVGEVPEQAEVDARHEDLAAEFLAAWFPPAVVRPIALHVAAKAYLCAARPGYRASLSEASRQSLALQGGPLDASGMERFLADPFARDAVALRRWDDAAKVPGASTRTLEDYRDTIIAVMTAERPEAEG